MTFARLAKLLAVLLVAAALWRARPPSAPARVVVLALPGASMDILTIGGRQPHPGEIHSPVPMTGLAFWRRLFASADDGARDPIDPPSLWSGDAAVMRSLAVPARLFSDPVRAATVEGAFVGNSSGIIVDAADITSGRLPAPYDRAVDAVSAAVGTLKREEWSDWIAVPPPAGQAASVASPVAEFQFARFTDTTYFFSPAYDVREGATVGSPFLRGLDRELRPLAAGHLVQLGQRRLGSSQDLFRDGSDGRPVVVFDTVAEDVSAVFTPDSTPSAVLERAREAIAVEVASLREAVGADGLVVVVGGPSTTRQVGATPWYVLVGGGDAARNEEGAAASPLEFDGARAMIRYVAGVSLDARGKALVPEDLVRRCPIRPRTAAPTVPAEPPSPRQEWSTAAIESVRGALGGGK